MIPAPSLDAAIFRDLFRAYPDALVVVDPNGTIILANPTAETMLGYAAGELAGMSIESLVPEAIRSRHAAYRAGYEQAPRARPMGMAMDLVARRRDGSEVKVEIALSPLQSEGRPYVIAAIRDVGSYPRVRQALQRARYSDCVAQMGRLAVDARDPQRLLERVPAAAAEALEVEHAALFLLDPEQREFRAVGGAGVGAENARRELRVPNAPDTLAGHVAAAGVPLLVADVRQLPPGLALHASALDAGLQSLVAVPMSDRGRPVGVLAAAACTPGRFGDPEVQFLAALANLLVASRQRQQSEEALAHSQRLESVGQLTGGIAHDFNNLLTVIHGNLQILEERPALGGDPQAQQSVAAATRAARRGAELTGKLLAFSRRQVLQPSRVDVGALLHSLADMLRRTLDTRIRIGVDAADDLPCVRADAGQLESALLNVAINARDAMPQGGRLGFSARRHAALPEALRAEQEPGDVIRAGYVAIAVSDTGCGMPEAVRERAFEPFFTTKEAGRGTGLGLSTVYGFARQSRGAVALDTAPGVGTTVTLYLPAGDAAEAADGDDDADDGASEARVPAGLRVLLVEDEPEVRDVAAAFLTALGCELTSCPDAEQALAALADADFDLLVTDVALGPGMRGTELARRAQVHSPEMAVLLVSGYAAEQIDDDESARDMARRELLHKPYRRAELARAIVRALGAG